MAESADTRRQTRSPYLIVFVILAVFTGLEVGASQLPVNIKIPALILLALIKGSLVVLYFMHLKSDSRVYAGFFLVAFILIIPLVLIMTLVMPLL
jgi:caa(3)-type oxidase subunit IV